MSRSLRALRRRVPSRIDQVLDEDETVRRIAEQDLWAPAYRPHREPWLDLLLVVDDFETMVIWRPAVEALERLLRRQGAFRQVRLVRLKADGPDESAQALRIADDSGRRAIPPLSLIAGEGQKVVWVLSDCMAPYWTKRARLWALLAGWAHRVPVTLVQMLPRDMWSGTGLGETPIVDLHSVIPACADTKLAVTKDSRAPARFLKLPISTIDPYSMRAWAGLILGRSREWASGLLFSTEQGPTDGSFEVMSGEPAVDIAVAAEQALEDFRAVASPQAQQLTAYYAALPLTLPVMRLAQQVLMPETRLTHLAEVFLGGLVERDDLHLPEERRERDPERIRFEFRFDIRRRLLITLPDTEVEGIIRDLSAVVERRLGRVSDFIALLLDPRGTGTVPLDEESLPFARVRLQVLKRLSGGYASMADELEEAISQWNVNGAAAGESHPGPTPFHDSFGDNSEPGPETVWHPESPRCVMLNAYPDSIGGTLSDTVRMLKRPEFEGVFSLFYILPTFFNSDLDRGFSIIDYNLNNQLVSREYLDDLDKLNIGLKLDLVLNHLSVASPQFQDMLKYGDESKYTSFFIDWNEFWSLYGEMSAEGYVVPKKEYLDMLFMRKPGLPILNLRFPDGTDRPYWNTFYQEAIYQKLVARDLLDIEGIGQEQAEAIAAIMNDAINAKTDLAGIDLGEFFRYKEDVMFIVESKLVTWGKWT